MKISTLYLLFSLILIFGIDASAWNTVVKDSAGNYKVVFGKIKTGVAWGKFDDQLHSNGWKILTIETNSNFDDQSQAYAAGYLEGQITMIDIHSNFVNMAPLDPPLDPRVADFPTKNLDWINLQVANSNSNSTLKQYWTQVGLTLQQSLGMFNGYNEYAPGPSWKLSWYQWNALQLGCEWGDINSTSIFTPASEDRLHCSGLVRLTPSNELFASHVTWSSYTWLLRVWKNYKFNFNSALTGTKAKKVSYSGYPGVIPSFDDFYITDQQLTIFETTNSVMNQELFKLVTPQTVPYWIRVTVATRMSESGKEWNQVFGLFNSGTYNNQWIVVDYKKFVPSSSQPVKPGLLWITEQIPGQLYGYDQSNFLNENRFWASYNIPYYPYIYNISGYPAVAKKDNTSSYEWCPRAQIFRRDAPKVNTLNDFKKIMRYNNYQQDPFSLNNACNGVSARCDLNYLIGNNRIPRLHGGLDAKISTQNTIKTMSAEIVSGPTWDDQLPFAWNQKWASNHSHLGHAKVYDFDFIKVTPDFN